MKNAVITYIFGENRELLREPLVVDEDTEYICVTDQTKLKSNVWKLIYDPMPEIRSLRDKMANVKYNPFKYTEAKNILVQDGSFEIKTSLEILFKEIENHDIGLKLHPVRDNLEQELPKWLARRLPQETIKNFYIMSSVDKIKLSDVKLYETSVILFKNTELCRQICKTQLKYMKLLGTDGQLIVTNQCPFSYIIHKYFKNMSIYEIQRNKYYNRYIHNTKRLNIEKR